MKYLKKFEELVFKPNEIEFYLVPNKHGNIEYHAVIGDYNYAITFTKGKFDELENYQVYSVDFFTQEKDFGRVEQNNPLTVMKVVAAVILDFIQHNHPDIIVANAMSETDRKTLSQYHQGMIDYDGVKKRKNMKIELLKRILANQTDYQMNNTNDFRYGTLLYLYNSTTVNKDFIQAIVDKKNTQYKGH